ncbi:YDG/SRA domain-containing protein [Streptomyces cremeus]|uniref:YDG/SRA domain-containing protein n=1 Tax=Streptomyces cremeus TaxID=66881 RepID=A0ABV5PHI0_STRCM
MNEILPGTHFASRKAVKAAGLHKEEQAGISWGLDSAGLRAADAIVLNQGYVDDQDHWDVIVYTGVGGRDSSTKKQVRDQSWETDGNEGLRRSESQGNPVRVIRGHKGEKDYSPLNGYRYDGLYEIVNSWEENGKDGFRICRFQLRRLLEKEQELTPLEAQLRDAWEGAARRKTATVSRIIRDTAVGKRVKGWYAHTCQICRTALPVGPDGESYAEGAHIQSLGVGKGPDVDGNVLCLCPNCHIRLDRGALYLTDNLHVVDRFAEGAVAPVKLRTVEAHRVLARFARAHRRYWNIVDESS